MIRVIINKKTREIVGMPFSKDGMTTSVEVRKLDGTIISGEEEISAAEYKRLISKQPKPS